MKTFLELSIVGVVVGCGYAVASLGLVVTYTTSGIFNFAHGAIGMLMAFAYWELHVNQGVPTLPALLIVLLILAPLTGAVIERVLMRPLHGSSTGTTLVVTLGLMLFLVGVALSIWDPGKARVAHEFFANHKPVHLAGINVSYHELTVVVLTALVAIGLRLFFYRTRTGIAMRAVVDDPELSALNGAAPARIAQLSWALGASLAGLAGILLAPLLYLDVLTLTLVVVNAYAAAIVGRLKNLPLTVVGALSLGLIESYFVGYLVGSKLSFNLGVGHLRVAKVLDEANVTKLALPVVFFFIVLLTMPQVRLRAGRLVGGRSPRLPGLRESVIGGVAFVALAWIVSGALSANNLNHAGKGLALGLIMLSLVLLTGYGAQVSLCQMTFVGLGAFAMGKVGNGGSVLGLVAAAAFAAPWGFLVSLPALRLTGLYLALATLAFARAMETLFFENRHVFGFGGRLAVGRIHLFGVSFHGDRAYFVLLAVVFAAAGIAILALRRGPFGRRLTALSDSPAACATLGLNQVGTKAIVFTLSAAMAGLAGALYGGQRGAVGPTDFLMIQSLVLLLSATIGGINTVSGAFLGGMLVALYDVLNPHLPHGFQGGGQYLLVGLAAISLAREPNGIVGSFAPIADRWRTRGARRIEPRVAGEVDRLAGVAG